MLSLNMIIIESIAAVALFAWTASSVLNWLHQAELNQVCPGCNGTGISSGFAKFLDSIESFLKGLKAETDCFFCGGSGTHEDFEKTMSEVEDRMNSGK